MPDLATPLSAILGDKTATALTDGLGLSSIGDLLHHYPRRYATRGEHTDIAGLTVGEQATIMGQVLRVTRRPLRNRRGSLLEVLIGADAGGDKRAQITVAFFNQAWRARELTPGRWGLFAGKVSEFRGDRQLQQPEYRLLPAEASSAEAADGAAGELEQFAGALIPVYPASAHAPTWVVSRSMRVALDVLDHIADPLPGELRAQRSLVSLETALRDIHRPPSENARCAARRRLAFDEALRLQLVLARRRAARTDRAATARPLHPAGLLSAFDAACPFELTEGQRSIGQAIAQDLAAATPMHRLLQGEVGSGKTLVALRAMLQVVDAGAQAVLVAPTEVLAAQHAHTIQGLLGALARAGELGAAESATRVALLTGSLPAAARRRALAEIAGGFRGNAASVTGDPVGERAGIVIGTHALFSDDVAFAEVGLVVIDEQHRFGVEQRDALREKASSAGGSQPHLLVMTATPIPRTVAMTVYGDLEISALTELPAGRSPITTAVVPVQERPAWLSRAWQRVCEEVAAGHQAYVVCPRIGAAADSRDEAEDVGELDGSPENVEDGESLRRPLLSVVDVAEQLRTGPLSGLRLGVLHGQLSSEEKESVMAEFAAGKIDVLVATTIVEVGVNVPNATVMVICDADRFGVSQLHQLRGRVGRGEAPGLCLLVTEAAPNSPAQERLTAVASTMDGFRLAELDLEQRREGDVLGAAQSGRRSTLKIVSLLRDRELITQACDTAIALVTEDPALTAFPELAAAVGELDDAEQADYLAKS